jgi:hypothetical protein
MFEFPNVTVPGPLTILHVVVNAPGGFGSPSSVAVPFSAAVFGRVIVWSVPALTVGAWFGVGVGVGVGVAVGVGVGVGLAATTSVAPCRVTLLQALNV